MNATPDPASPHTNITVSASAGTGKTWLLVTRLVRLLLAGAAPEAILAITFTRKAAAEMHARLSERLLGLACADDERLGEQLRGMGATDDGETVARARRLYEVLLHARRPVRTTTFHAFCQEILRSFPLEADVPPGFELLEQTGELERAAWDALVDEATTAPDGAVGKALETLLDHCGGLAGMQSALNSFLSHRSDWWALTADTQEPAAAASERLADALAAQEGEDPRETFLSSGTIEGLAEFRELLSRHPIKAHLSQAEQLADALEAARCRQPDFEHAFARTKEALFTQSGTPRARKASQAQAKAMGEAGQARFLELHETLCANLADALDRLAAQRTLCANRAWYLAGEHLLEHFQRLKSERRLLDFADLEWKAYRLLNRADAAQWVQYKLDRRIDHLLVDEFQDTNPTQWRLLLPLLEEMASQEDVRGRSVFLVGDAKQSIYRFRRADPELFHTAHHWLTGRLAAHAHPMHVSRRSAPAVMGFVNRLFSGERLKGHLRDFAEHDTHLRDLWGRVELLPLTEPEEEPTAHETAEMRNPLLTPRPSAEDTRHVREGREVARRISELLDGPLLLGPEDEARPVRYSDIMLLARSRNHIHAYEKALQEAGIPHVGADRGTLLESLEVRDMVSLLEVLITPYNDLSLVTVLRCPLFACTDADLMQLAQVAKGASWRRALARTAETEGPDSVLGRAHHCLERWMLLAGRLPIHDLLDRVYDEGDLIARYQAAYPPHLRPRVAANLIRFIELALEVDSGRYPSLTHFLARLGELRRYESDAPDEAPATAGQECVRIMTIHAAKGLEAPVVFLVDAAAPPPRERSYRALVDWPADRDTPEHFLLVGRKEQRDPLSRRLLETERKMEEREAANLLYVAVTRAKQLLYISGSAPARGEGTGWWGDAEAALGEGHWSLTSGEPPRSAGGPPRETSAPAPLPPELTRRLELEPLSREIAPSRSAGGRHAGPTDEDGRLRGIAIHRFLERLATLPGEEPQAYRQQVADELGINTGDADLIEWWEEAEAVHQDPALKAVFGRSPAHKVYTEVPVQFEAQGRLVHGIVDRLIVSEDEAWVIDYKSHRAAGVGNLAELAAPYREQMRWYAEAAQRLWPGRRTRASLLFTACRTLFDVELKSGGTEPYL